MTDDFKKAIDDLQKVLRDELKKAVLTALDSTDMTGVELEIVAALEHAGMAKDVAQKQAHEKVVSEKQRLRAVLAGL
jgi:hypothetical protein